MNCILLARISLSFLCAIQGMATLAIDLNRTHAANPAWTGHARFHVVWQSASVALLSVLELALIWMRGPYREGGFYLASLLAAVSPLGFLIACATRRIFAGALSDPNGIPPFRGTLFGVDISIDMNLVAVVAALLTVAAVLVLYRM